MHLLLLLLAYGADEPPDPRVGTPDNCTLAPDKRPAETPYNGVDDDCSPLTRDDDLDSDGLLRALDCDDREPDDTELVEGPLSWTPDPRCDQTDRAISVRGDLVVDRETSTLQGLGCVCAISGDLDLTGNQKIPSLTGLTGLTRVGGSVKLVGMHRLTSTRGADALEQIGGDLRIEQNPELTYVEGFPLLETVGGSVVIANNQRLYSIRGFDRLQRVGGNLVIADNPALVRIEAMALLDTVGGEVQIRDNPSLETVAGLDRVVDLDAIFPGRSGPLGRLSSEGVSWPTVIGGFALLAIPVGVFLFFALPMLSGLLFQHDDERKAADGKKKRVGGLGKDFFEHLRFGADEPDRMHPRALDGLDAVLLEAALQQMSLHELAYGDTLLYAGTGDTWAAWVVRGDLEVQLNGVEIGQGGSDTVLGGIGLFEDRPVELDVRAVGETRVLTIDRAGYDTLAAADHPAATHLERAVLATQAILLRGLRAKVALARLGLRSLPALAEPTSIAKRLEAWADTLSPQSAGAPPASARALLDQLPAFASLPPEWRHKLADEAVFESFAPGEPLFVQGDRDGHLFLLAGGRVELLQAFREPATLVPIGTLLPGDLFGCNSLLTGTARDCSAAALSRVTTLVIDPELATGLLELDHPMGRAVRVALIRSLAASRRAALADLTNEGPVAQAALLGPLRALPSA